MKHVFVETNWVVDVLAPPHQRDPAAVRLREQAMAGTIVLHVPSVSLTEARKVLRTDRKAKSDSKAIRTFQRWFREQHQVEEAEVEAVHRLLSQMDTFTEGYLASLETHLRSLRESKGIHVFPLSAAMLERSVELATTGPELKPWDEAILAAILVRADELRAGGIDRCYFCEIDADLLPWDRRGNRKPSLLGLYDAHRIWVYDDWDVSGEPWDGWPDADPPEAP